MGENWARGLRGPSRISSEASTTTLEIGGCRRPTGAVSGLQHHPPRQSSTLMVRAEKSRTTRVVREVAGVVVGDPDGPGEQGARLAQPRAAQRPDADEGAAGQERHQRYGDQHLDQAHAALSTGSHLFSVSPCLRVS